MELSFVVISKKIKYKKATANGKVEVSIDEGATAAELSSLSAEDRKWLMQFAKYFLSSYSSGSVSDNEVQSQPPGLLLKQLHPGKPVAEAVKMEFDQAQAEAASLKNLSPMEKALYFNNTTPDRIAFIGTHVANGTIDENETREIIKWNMDVRRSKSYFRDPNSPLLSRDTPSVEDIIKKGGGVDAIAKGFEQNRVDDRKKNEGKIQSCKMQYFLNKALLPSKEQVDRLNQDIKRSKQMVVEMIKAKFPSSIQPKLIKTVEDSDFITPPSAADFERNFTNSLRQKLDSQRTNTAAMGSIAPEDMRSLISIFSLSKASQDSADSKDDSNSFCDAFKYSPMSDGNYTTYGSIMLSFTTATGDEASRLKTIMHELGHTVSKAIADDPKESERLSSVRKCFAYHQTEDLPVQTKKNYDEALKANPKSNGPYAEEDFADSVAGESGRTVQGRNAWCQFLSLSQDRQQYLESSMQSADGDPHSASLFRLLNFEIMKKGAIPDSCTSFLKTAKYTQHFSSCLDLASPKSAPSNVRPSGIAR